MDSMPLALMRAGLVKSNVAEIGAHRGLAYPGKFLRDGLGSEIERERNIDRAFRKSGDHYGAMIALSFAAFRLSQLAFDFFCRHTPDGEKFWQDFQAYKKRSHNSGDCAVIDYAREIVRQAGTP